MRLPPRPLHPLPPVAVTLAIGLVLFVWMLPIVANDMAVFLVPWFDHIVGTGPVAAFAAPFSNYSPAYLYLLAGMTGFQSLLPAVVLIKLLSLAGTGALALAVRHLLVRLDAPQPGRAAALVFLLPSVMLNAGLLGQCDAISAAAAVMAVAAALERRHLAMLAWCGLALGFKAQALLIAPFFVALLINCRVAPWAWGIVPLAMAATMLPAWAAGWPAGDLATIYLRQADTYERLALNAPNIWAIAQALPGLRDLPLTGLAFAATIGVTGAYVARISARPLSGRGLVSAALLCSLVTAGLLPHMHERYFFLADILSLTLALATRDRLHWRIALLVQLGSTLALLGYISGIDGAAMLGGVAMLSATFLLARAMFAGAANDNPLMPRTA